MREKKTNRRISSILRDNLVHEIYNEECKKLGEAGSYVSREYLYNKVKERTRLSKRSFTFISKFGYDNSNSFINCTFHILYLELL